MITRKTIKRSQARKILKLIEEWTRADVMARIGPSAGLEFADWYTIKLEKADELRELIFGTSCIVELGKLFDIIKTKKRRKKKTQTEGYMDIIKRKK